MFFQRKGEVKNQRTLDILLEREANGENVSHLIKKQFPWHYEEPEVEDWEYFYCQCFMELSTERYVEGGPIPSSKIRDFALHDIKITEMEFPFFMRAMRELDNAICKYMKDQRPKQQQAESKKSNLKKITSQAIKAQKQEK